MQAKRIILYLLAVSVLSAFGYILPLAICHITLPAVTLCTPSQSSFTKRIPLAGSVVAQNKSELICELPLIPSAVLVSVGDQVAAGDTAAIIDKEQTLKNLASLLSAAGSLKQFNSSLSTLLEQYKIESYADMLSLIPSKLILPASGTVLSSSLKANAMTTPGVSCLTVADCASLSVSLSANESDAEKLSVGDILYLKSGATEDRVFTATVTEIAPAASEVLSGTSIKTVVDVTASLTLQDVLKPGYSVYGYRFDPIPEAKLLLPTDAVFQQGEVECVYLFEKGKAVITPVKTDGFYGAYTVITSGITKQSTVILPQNGKELTDGKRVRIAG